VRNICWVNEARGREGIGCAAPSLGSKGSAARRGFERGQLRARFRDVRASGRGGFGAWLWEVIEVVEGSRPGEVIRRSGGVKDRWAVKLFKVWLPRVVVALCASDRELTDGDVAELWRGAGAALANISQRGGLDA
jgi:hypothetical protein